MSLSYQIIKLRERADSRGHLIFAQEGDDVPFPVKRMFVLFDITDGSQRADHAHRQQHQFLVMLKGSCRATIDNGLNKHDLTLASPIEALYLPPMNWLTLAGFTTDAVCAVLSSGVYEEADYIRNYAEFQSLTAAAR